MRMPKVRVETQKTEFEIRTTPAKLNIRSTRPKMQIRRAASRMTVDHKLPMFKVDWSAVRTESGLAPPEQMIRKWRDEGKEGALEAIASISVKGDRMMHIENKNDSIGAMRRDYDRERLTREVNIGLIPQNSPKVEWEHGYVNLDWTTPQLDIEWDVGGLEMYVEPHSVEVTIKQYPHVKITVVQEEVQEAAGRKVDRKI